MSELSNALRQRLGAGVEPRVHPDTDTLTAYLEQLLPAAERNQVLEHLAVCRQCREVTALSLPELPVAQDRPAAMALPAGGGWRAWIPWKPALGLAASLAGLAIVATVIVELPRGSVESGQKQAVQPAPVSSASNNAPAAVPIQPESVAEQPGSIPANAVSREPASRTGLASAKPPSASTVGAAETAIRKPTPNTVDTAVAGSYVNSLMFAGDAGNAVPSLAELPAAPVPHTLVDHAQNSVFLNNGNGNQLTFADAPHQTQSSKPLRILTPPAGSSRFGLSMVTTIGRDAKQLFRRPAPAISAYGFATSAMGGAGQFNPSKQFGAPSEVAAAPLAGGDAAELDQSRAFTARALADAGLGKLEATTVEERARRAGASTSWKVADSKLLKLGDSGVWTEAYSSSEGIQFSVASSYGSNIWAGGSNAALVHSRDGGVTWERIALGASAAGTITSIEVNGVKVLVRSSSGQSWSSPDGGKTWTLQD